MTSQTEEINILTKEQELEHELYKKRQDALSEPNDPIMVKLMAELAVGEEMYAEGEHMQNEGTCKMYEGEVIVGDVWDAIEEHLAIVLAK